jgi:hypothetical protein
MVAQVNSHQGPAPEHGADGLDQQARHFQSPRYEPRELFRITDCSIAEIAVI